MRNGFSHRPQYHQKFGLSSRLSVCASLCEVSLAPGPLGLEVDAPTGLVQKVLEGGAGVTRLREVCSLTNANHLLMFILYFQGLWATELAESASIAICCSHWVL